MDLQLLERLLNGESERVEWKESARDSEEIYRAVCALANDLGDSGEPGYLVLGVTKSGDVVGVTDDPRKLDEAQRTIADRLRSTRLLPTPSFDVTPASCRGKTVLVVQVAPYPVPPVVEVNGVAWVRVGSTTRRATEVDLARLRERRPEGVLPFDTRSVLVAGIDDLDTTRLRAEYDAQREQNGYPETFPTFEEWLTQLELGRVVRGVWRPCAAALLVYGRSPQTFFPGAVVEFARYGGPDVSAPLTMRRTITGNLPTQLDAIWSVLAANLAEIPAGAEGMRERFVFDYPLDAVRELGRNMVQHRQFDATHAPSRIEWYEDRIEFSNPGAPFGQAAQGEFGTHSDYRNPTVTKFLVRLGYVERLGRGIRLVRRLLSQNGNPRFEVETDGFTRVVVWRRR